MSFNNLQPATGPIHLVPGATVGVWVSRNNGSDFGAQWIMAHPIDTKWPTALRVTNHTKRLSYSIGWVNSEGDGGFAGPPTYTYECDVTNVGDYEATFSLQGGGNS